MLVQVHSNSYRAFDSINHPPLAILGVEVDWNTSQMLKVNRSCCTLIPFPFIQTSRLARLPCALLVGHVSDVAYGYPAGSCICSCCHAEGQQHAGEWSVQAALQAGPKVGFTSYAGNLENVESQQAMRLHHKPDEVNGKHVYAGS